MEFKSGMKFKWKGPSFDDDIIETTVEIEKGRLYLCQDSHDGNKCLNRHGYKYSFEIEKGSIESYAGRLEPVMPEWDEVKN